MDQDITNTPRSNARRNERDGRTLDSPERRRIPQGPQGPQLDLPPQPFPLPANALPVGPVQFNDPFQNNYAPPPASIYQHLPAHLAQAVANLPPLLPVRGRGRGRPRGRGNYLNWRPVQNSPATPPVSFKWDIIHFVFLTLL